MSDDSGFVGTAFDYNNRLLRQGAEWGFFGEAGKSAVTIHEAGAIVPEEARDDLRDHSAEMDDSGFSEALAVSGATRFADVTDSGQQIQDDVDYRVQQATQAFPWWTKYAVGGVGLLVLLIALRPYASIGSGVVS